MPHSTQDSVDSNGTFDLSSDPRPTSSQSDSTVQPNQWRAHSRAPSTSFGVAVTSSPSRDAGRDLSSQRDSTSTVLRNGGPATPDNESDAATNTSSINGALLRRRPGDRNSMRSFSSNDISSRKTLSFEDDVQSRDSAGSSTKQRLQRQSPVIAELKTNVIIKDEFTLVTDLSYHLARRYARPESCIMVKLDHSSCLAFGGAFDPCYVLSVNAIPSQMGPANNKRNAAKIQQFMADILSVPANRGIVTFIPIPEDNFAIDGSTILSDTEHLEKKKNPQAVKGAIQDGSRNGTIVKKKSTGDLDRASKASDSVAASSVSEEERVKKPPPQEHSSSSSEDSTAERPKTTQSSRSFDHGQNGLRMNGISAEAEQAARSSRIANGGPEPIGAAVPSSEDQQIKTEPTPQAKKEPAPPIKNGPIQQQAPWQDIRSVAPWETTPQTAQITTKIEPQRPKHIPLQVAHVPNPVLFAPRPQDRTSSLTNASVALANDQTPRNPIAESRQKNTYLDNVSTLTSKIEPKTTVTEDTSLKRRSTITATPKIMQAPPSPHLREEAKSISSRLSKRKSFIKIFKRETVPPWYKQ